MKEASKTRIEHDSMGDVAVPANRYWGAQTQRSLEHFPIGVGKETMPLEIVHAFGLVKHAAARVNRKLCADRMTAEKLPLAALVDEEELRCDHILPAAFDPRVRDAVAAAVSEAARSSSAVR